MSAQVTGVVSAALVYGYNSLIEKRKRSFGNANDTFKDYIVFEEMHEDELEITNSPIEQGAAITDHAYQLPAKLTIKIGWSNSPSEPGLLGGIRGLINTGQIVVSNILGESSSQINEIYTRLLKCQSSREPVSVFTGKREYTDMLIKSLMTTTDKNSENYLSVTVSFQQIIRVTTSVITSQRVPAANQQNPGSTQAPVNSGVKQATPTANVDTDMFGRVLNPQARR